MLASNIIVHDHMMKMSEHCPFLKIIPQALVGALLLLLTACAHFTPPGRSIYNGNQEGLRESVVFNALALVNTPYHYGGDTPNTGFDCSGLVSYVYNQAGLQIPRTVVEQSRGVRQLDLVQLEPGDLVFFRLQGQISHVGIYLGNGDMIHAPSQGGRVRVESITNHYWRKRYMGGGKIQQYVSK
jgi:cell wall-associated NlpC family hydrolase